MPENQVFRRPVGGILHGNRIAQLFRSNDDKRKKFEELTEVFSTLKREIWEQFSVMERVSIDVDWNSEIRKRPDAYPKLDYEYEKSVIRKIYTEPEEAFAFLHSLKPCRGNAFFLNTQKEWEPSK